MAKVVLTVPDNLEALVEAAWGGTLSEHLQARIDPIIERWLVEASEIPKQKRLDKYSRLNKTKQTEVDNILKTALEPEEDLEPKLPEGKE